MKKTKLNSKPKKVLEEIKEEEIKEEIKEVLIEDVPVTKRAFIYGDFITDSHTGKTMIFHGQNCVNENPSRYVLVAPNL